MLTFIYTGFYRLRCKCYNFWLYWVSKKVFISYICWRQKTLSVVWYIGNCIDYIWPILITFVWYIQGILMSWLYEIIPVTESVIRGISRGHYWSHDTAKWLLVISGISNIFMIYLIYLTGLISWYISERHGLFHLPQLTDTTSLISHILMILLVIPNT